MTWNVADQPAPGVRAFASLLRQVHGPALTTKSQETDQSTPQSHIDAEVAVGVQPDRQGNFEGEPGVARAGRLIDLDDVPAPRIDAPSLNWVCDFARVHQPESAGWVSFARPSSRPSSRPASPSPVPPTAVDAAPEPPRCAERRDARPPQRCDADVWAFALQEVDTSTSFTGHPTSQIMDWIGQLAAALDEIAPTAHFRVVCEHHCGPTVLLVAMREPLAARVRERQCRSTTVGFLSLGMNKGALALRFSLSGVSFCFVASHLNAGEGTDNLQRRNADYHQIVKGLDFDYDTRRVSDHDCVFWLGDLNYRLTASRPHVLAQIARADWPGLVATDELTRARMAHTAFGGFSEPPIGFAPSYKLQPHARPDVYVEDRVPSYTDRVLYLGGARVLPSGYMRLDSALSDHRPVAASFVVDLRGVSDAAGRRAPAEEPGLLEGLHEGTRRLTLGVYQGLTGIVREPMRGMHRDGVPGFVGGLFTGALGVVAEPVNGVYEFATHSGKGVMNTLSNRAAHRYSDRDPAWTGASP